MEFNINKRDVKKSQYDKKDLDVVFDFSSKIKKEFGDYIKAIVLFGSTSTHKKNKNSDLDILVVIDDVSIVITPEIIEAYRIITEKIIAGTSNKIHLTTIKFTTFWEYSRAADPVIVNILRTGVAVYDSGFFEPLQILLFQGRIRPTQESVWNYFNRAPKSLVNSKMRFLSSIVDFYWAIVDSAHAVIMSVGEVPPQPGHLPKMMNELLVPKGIVDKGDVETLKNFYILMKKITTGDNLELSGVDYDNLKTEAENFVSKMKSILVDNESKKR